MTVAALKNPPVSALAIRQTPQTPADVDSDEPWDDDPVAEALAFATRIAAQIRKPGDATPLGVPRVA
jgi:hypothetical protein